jgi:hypothetical protein
VITFRVYVVNRDTGERQELGAHAYEPGAAAVPLGGAFDLPPCRCPVCRTSGQPALTRDAC